jgi:predicted small secreted protein
METMKKIALSLAALFTLTAVVACNTIEGVGEDVEATGEAVSGASREVRD